MARITIAVPGPGVSTAEPRGRPVAVRPFATPAARDRGRRSGRTASLAHGFRRKTAPSLQIRLRAAVLKTRTGNCDTRGPDQCARSPETTRRAAPTRPSARPGAIPANTSPTTTTPRLSSSTGHNQPPPPHSAPRDCSRPCAASARASCAARTTHPRAGVPHEPSLGRRQVNARQLTLGAPRLSACVLVDDGAKRLR